MSDSEDSAARGGGLFTGLAARQAVATLLWLLLLTRLLASLAGAVTAADLLRLPTLASSMLGWLATALVLWRLGAAPGDTDLPWVIPDRAW